MEVQYQKTLKKIGYGDINNEGIILTETRDAVDLPNDYDLKKG